MAALAFSMYRVSILVFPLLRLCMCNHLVLCGKRLIAEKVVHRWAHRAWPAGAAAWLLGLQGRSELEARGT